MKSLLRFLFGDWPSKRPLLLRGVALACCCLLSGCARGIVARTDSVWSEDGWQKPITKSTITTK